jgi:hypothetical protein
MIQEDFDRLNMFLARVNKVVSYHRHGVPIPKSALSILNNEHIEMELWLEDHRPGVDDISNYDTLIKRLKKEDRPHAIIATDDPDVKIVKWSYFIDSLSSYEGIYNTKSGEKFYKLPPLKK